MFKSIMIVAAVMLSIGTAQAQFYANGTDPTGFRDLSWGDTATKIKNPIVLQNEGNESYISNQDDKMFIGKYELTGILYRFYADSLEGVIITASGVSTCGGIKRALDAKYKNEGTQANQYIDSYLWYRNDNRGEPALYTNFRFGSTTNECTVHISNLTINKQKKLNNEAKAAQAAQGDF